MSVELKLEVWDSPNSAGVMIDAVRCVKVAQDRGIGGPLGGASAYFMKSPPVQYHDDVARQMVEEFAAALPAPELERPSAAGRASVALVGPGLGSPPLVEQVQGVIVASGALFQAGLEKVGEGVADEGPWPQAEVGHDLAGRRGQGGWRPALPFPSARRCEPRDPPCAAQGFGPRRVTRRAIGPRQFVELLKQIAGVADVAADGAVGPAHRRRCGTSGAAPPGG